MSALTDFDDDAAAQSAMAAFEGLPKELIIEMGNGRGAGQYVRQGMPFLSAYAKALDLPRPALVQALRAAPGSLTLWERSMTQAELEEVRGAEASVAPTEQDAMADLEGLPKELILEMSNGCGAGQYVRRGMPFLSAYAKALDLPRPAFVQALRAAPGSLGLWAPYMTQAERDEVLRAEAAASLEPVQQQGGQGGIMPRGEPTGPADDS